MSNCRRSYSTTTLAALAVATLSLLLAIVSLLSWGTALEARQLVLIPLSLLCLAVGSIAGLVALGGSIALRRDALERAGKPYFSDRRRERSPGFLSRLRRQVLGLKPASSPLGLWPGEWVRVRPFSEIAATLDTNGCLDGLPFMPEMLPLCGKYLPVFRRIDKVHDYYTPGRTGLRRLRDCVTLDDQRCNGKAHGGCQAACQFIWKEAWLEPATGPGDADELPATPEAGKLEKSARRVAPEGGTQYFCQMTELPKAGQLMWWHDPRHYLRDLWSGNVRLVPLVKAVALALFNIVQRKTRGPVAPHREAAERVTGQIPPLDLKPGDLVRIKSKGEIEKTLMKSKNRGLWFDVEMHRYCGGTFRVAARIETIINEADGRMLTMKTPCVVLDGVKATGEYIGLCPQVDLIFWREAWLERLGE